ncbi:MAG: hypothetical protein D3913_09870 [Candidatus Electrothrix sp. LOE1_4_5]|nr:hypothetical protein [Candidatus Electrothrix sp. AX1]MCI5118249.1 hypothetical protein [Candidatus Electrothrix gigas]MCI5181855.1 hypothetical protein [Candidatus Electrothrix gigas]
MKLYLICPQCGENRAVGETYKVFSDSFLVSDSGIYEFQCPKGHQHITILRMQKHDLLFNLGITAFLDNYYRESLANFASSLERYYEFALRVIYRSAGIDKSIFEKNWKFISNQSERQLGAFIFSWGLYENNIFTDNSLNMFNKMSSLRNKVIHKGKILSEEECRQYGEHTFSLIKYINEKITQKDNSSYEEEYFLPWRASREKTKNKYKNIEVCNLSMPHFLEKESFRDALESARKFREKQKKFYASKYNYHVRVE